MSSLIWEVLVGFLHALAEHVPQQVALAAGSQGDSQAGVDARE